LWQVVASSDLSQVRVAKAKAAAVGKK